MSSPEHCTLLFVIVSPCTLGTAVRVAALPAVYPLTSDNPPAALQTLGLGLGAGSSDDEQLNNLLKHKITFYYQ